MPQTHNVLGFWLVKLCQLLSAVPLNNVRACLSLILVIHQAKEINVISACLLLQTLAIYSPGIVLHLPLSKTGIQKGQTCRMYKWEKKRNRARSSFSPCFGGWFGRKLINKIFLFFYCRFRFYAFTIPFPRPVMSIPSDVVVLLVAAS